MLNTGAISRAARGLYIDQTVALDEREQMLNVDALGEIEQQFQLPIHGKATNKLAFAERELFFDVHFYDAVDQRNIPYTEPGFYFGAVITSDKPVLVTAVVRRWVKRGDGAVTGCVVALGVMGSTKSRVVFEGSLHIFFQGYGAPVDSDAEMEAPDESGGIDTRDDAPDPGDPGEEE